MEKTKRKSFTVNGANLLDKVKELIEEGKTTKIIIQDAAGKELMSFPLAVGVAGVVLAPVLAAVGALAVFLGDCSVIAEREEEE